MTLWRNASLVISGMMFMLLTASSQTVLVPIRHPVYEFVDRLEASYRIGIPSFVRPMSRMDVAEYLDRVRRTPGLTRHDRDQTEFYAEEFQDELRRLHAKDSLVTVAETDRWHLAHIRTTTPVDGSLMFDFVGAAGYQKKQSVADVFTRSSGIRARGYVSSSIGFSMLWTDNARRGMPHDARSYRVPEQGVVRGPGSSSNYEYEIAEGAFTWSNDWLRIGVDKHDRWYGSGRVGAIILSDKAPSFPALSLQIRLAEWLHFDYTHGWLFSDSLDLDRTQPFYAGFERQKIYAGKYFVTHAVTARPADGLQIALGESIIYSESVQPLFLIPVISFRAADRWSRASTGNSQFFADVRWTPVAGVTAYGTGYVDELDASKIFSPDEPDFDYHIAYTVGLLATDIHMKLTGLASDTRIEFSRVYPYVYANPKITQQYTSHQVVLGHWMGANADHLLVEHVLRPWRAVSIRATASLLRSGEWREFLPSPPRHQPAFLYGHEYSVATLSGAVTWQPLHDVSFVGEIMKTTITRGPNFTLTPWVDGLTLRVGASYGVY